MKKTLIMLAAVVGLASLTFGAVTKGGANYTKAVSLSGTKSVQTVAETDPDDGNNPTGNYVAWLKFTATRGRAYTVVVTRDGSEEQAEVIWSELYDESMLFEKKSEVYLPSFTSDTDPDGLSDRHILFAEDWDDDPDGGHAKSGVFYLCISSGESEETVTVKLVNGEEEYDWPTGSEERPQTIKPGTDAEKYSGALSLYGEFYFETSALSAGHRYDFWTTGGTADNALDLSAGAADDVEEPDSLYFQASGQKENDTGLAVIPTEKGKVRVCVTGSAGEMGKPFVLHYRAIAFRKIADHPVAATVSDITTEPQVFDCQPGNRNKKDSKYWDRTIDTTLYKVSLTKGKYYVFSTQGADTNLLMEVYDESGKVAENRRGYAAADRAYDCRLVYKAPSTGSFWVGVCQDLTLEEDDAVAATAGACKFSVQELGEEQIVLDDFDPADDTYAGATPLVPGIAKTALEGSAADGEHTLGATDRADFYSVICRKDYIYKFQAVPVDPEDPSSAVFQLRATFYRLVDGKLKSVESFADLAAAGGVRFEAPASETYYLKVEVSVGGGVDYGSHRIWSSVWSKKSDLGYLDVRIGGATASEGAGWAIAKDGEPFYGVGVCAVAVKEAGYQLKFAKVKGWTAPANVTSAPVVQGETTVVEVKYNDEHDAGDLSKDATEGDGALGGKKRTELSPAATEKTERRSLWQADLADWYFFKAKAFSRYRLALKGVTGDAVMSVSNKTDAASVADETRFAEIRAEKADTYVVKVAHGAPECPDSQYALAYSGVQVGQVGFAKTAVAVKDSDDSVSLTVSRTGGKSGIVSVRYATVSGEGEEAAVANENYIPTSGTLTWADGASGDKTITVKLLPQLKAHWDVTRTFTVKLEAVDAAEGTELPFLGTAVETVKIKPATKMAVGKVQFTAKSVSTPAGEAVTLVLTRTGGDDGQIGVTVKTADDTAKKDTDYEAFSRKLVWDDGVATNQEVTLVTKYAGDGSTYRKTRKLTVSVAADKSQPYEAKIGDVKKVTVALTDPTVTRTFEDYQAACKSLGALTIKADAAETWYFDADETFRSVTPAKGKTAKLTLTFEGPGKFAFTPTFEIGGSTKNTVACTIDKKAVTLTDGQRVLKYLKSGKHTVVFTVKRATTSVEGNVSLSFENDEESGLPFLWKPLPAAKRVAPIAGATVQPGGVLDWTVDDEDSEVTTFLTLATSEKGLDKRSSALVFDSTNEPAAEVSVKLAEAFPEAGWTNGKTYYWRVDTAFCDDEGAVLLRRAGTAWSFKTCVEGAPKTLFEQGAVDAYGEEIAEPEEGMPYEVRLVQGVKAAMKIMTDDTTEGKVAYAYKLAGGKLPDGVALSESGKLSKAPTKAGTFTSVLQVSRSVTTGSGKGKKTVTTKGETLFVKFVVAPIGLAAGTFTGLVSTGDERVADCLENDLGALEIGSVKVSVSSKGEITAKAVVGGTTYTFKKTGYDRVESGLADTEDGAAVSITNVTKVSYKKDGKTKNATVTNVFELVSCRAEKDEDGLYSRVGLDFAMPVTLRLSVPTADGKSVCRDIVWTGHALRDNTGIAEELELIKPFAKYCTVSLCPSEPVDGVSGNGYLTVSISSKGVAKVAGLLADGSTKISASSACGYLSDEASECADGEVLVPVFVSSAKKSFGGWLRLSLGEDGLPVVRTWTADPETTCGIGMKWINASAKSTVDGTVGYGISVDPLGGYYSTVENLQRYYYDLGYSLVVPSLDLNELSLYLLSGSWDFIAYPGCRESGEEDLVLNDNAIGVAKQKLKYRTDNKKLVDWQASTNPSNLKFSFTRASGVYSGSFELWKNNGADKPSSEKDSKIGTYKHHGVLLLTRDAEAPLAFEENAAPGFYNVKVTVEEEDDKGKTQKREVTTSYPFVIAPKEFEKPVENPEEEPF